MKTKMIICVTVMCCIIMLIMTSCHQEDNPASPAISSMPSIAVTSSETPSSEVTSTESEAVTSSEAPTPTPTPTPTKEELEATLASLINNIRAAYGLEPYDFNDAQLNETAQIRVQELAQSYSHTRPDGTSCATAFPEYGAAGENMSKDYNTPENVYTYWMASPTNRSNILDEQGYHYSKASIKLNIAEDGTYYWVMCVMATLEDVPPYVPPVSAVASAPAA